MNPVLRIARARHSDWPLPAYETEGAAGIDLRAAEDWSLDWTVIELIPTGIMVEIPAGYVGILSGRSSMGRRGIVVLEGRIDSDYRGEIMVQAYALDGQDIAAGERIAQLVIAPVARCEVLEVEPADLTPTARGAGGFGSTGAR